MAKITFIQPDAPSGPSTPNGDGDGGQEELIDGIEAECGGAALAPPATSMSTRPGARKGGPAHGGGCSI
jgi:hypothetical protein